MPDLQEPSTQRQRSSMVKFLPFDVRELAQPRAVNDGATPTFGVFVTGNANVPFDPGNNRVFVRFKDAGRVTRGATSVAVRTQ